MQTRHFFLALILATFALGLGACSGDPLKGVPEVLKSGDFAKAEKVLSAVVEKKPELQQAHAYLFALYRHLSVHGPADQQQAFVKKSIAEYDFLAQALGMKPTYDAMEDSLRNNARGAVLLKTARGPLYGE